MSKTVILSIIIEEVEYKDIEIIEDAIKLILSDFEKHRINISLQDETILYPVR